MALVGTYPPRRCGIATFTASLRQHLIQGRRGADALVVACDDLDGVYAYPEHVWLRIAEGDKAQYERAARFLDASRVDVVCVQHEFSIYGGARGAHVLALMRALRAPVITTLHTIVSDPYPDQLEVMAGIAAASRRLVTMSHTGSQLLQDVYGIAAEKVVVIPHGVPRMPVRDVAVRKARRDLGVAGKTVLLTCGLIRPKKGIEHMIAALPAIVANYPDVVYLIVGATWPTLQRREGEAYRAMLQQLARETGVEGRVLFRDGFLSEDELIAHLLAADVYVAPYLSSMQIASGTLAYAFAAGKAVVATPFPYARELLAEDRGLLVPFASPVDLAGAVTSLLDDERRRLALGRSAQAFGRSMTWDRVARAYACVLRQVVMETPVLVPSGPAC